MDDVRELIAIQQELKGISDRLRKIFPQTHPQFDDVFEDIGAAGYYMREAGYRLESVLLTVQGDSAASSSHRASEERGMSSIRAENRVNRHYMSNTRIFRS